MGLPESGRGGHVLLITIIELLLSLFNALAFVKHLIDEINETVLVVLEAQVGHIGIYAGLGKLGQVPKMYRKKRS